MNLIDIKIPPSLFNEQFESFEKGNEKRAMISVLIESMPVYSNSVLSNPNLDDAQIESLKLLYLPVVDEFVKKGKPELIEKAQSIKNLIINGELRASLK